MERFRFEGHRTHRAPEFELPVVRQYQVQQDFAFFVSTGRVLFFVEPPVQHQGANDDVSQQRTGTCVFENSVPTVTLELPDVV